MSEQSLSWFRVYGAIIVRSANRRSLIWSWWRSSAQRRRRHRHWLRFRIRIRVGLVTFAFPATHRRHDDVGRAMWAYMVARLGDGFLSAPRHLQSIFKLRFKFFRMFFFISVFYFFQIYFFFWESFVFAHWDYGDWRRHVFFRSNCFSLFCGSFICYSFARVCVCVCVWVCCFFLLVW